ncbi:MAG: hypothetical protein AMXMBFR84_21100 [Candidatus Hydrogenedentota bacterium]
MPRGAEGARRNYGMTTVYLSDEDSSFFYWVRFVAFCMKGNGNPPDSNEGFPKCRIAQAGHAQALTTWFRLLQMPRQFRRALAQSRLHGRNFAQAI